MKPSKTGTKTPTTGVHRCFNKPPPLLLRSVGHFPKPYTRSSELISSHVQPSHRCWNGRTWIPAPRLVSPGRPDRGGRQRFVTSAETRQQWRGPPRHALGRSTSHPGRPDMGGRQRFVTSSETRQQWRGAPRVQPGRPTSVLRSALKDPGTPDQGAWRSQLTARDRRRDHLGDHTRVLGSPCPHPG